MKKNTKVEKDIREIIRELYHSGKSNYRGNINALARKFNFGWDTIKRIISEKK